MPNIKFPSFNYPYTASEDLRQFLVDYGRTGPVHVFKNGQNVECIPQKKAYSENAEFISEKPTLPLNFPGLNEEYEQSDEEEKAVTTGKYYGNCLAFSRSTSSDSGFLLVSPGGPTMSELRFSHLDIDCRNDSVRLGAQTGNISLPERICQISMTNEIDQANVIAVRTLDYKCWFFQNESCNVSEKPTFLGNLQCKTKPCSIAVNPYIPEEAVISMETGSMWLWNVEDNSVKVIRQCSSCTLEEFDWYFTEFGSHPRQVVRGNATNIEVIDIRSDSSTSQDVMTLPSPHFFSDDNFTAIKRYYDNPYHYILGTTQSLVIMDTRFQQHPVLKWCHNLEYPVKHINAVPNPTNEDVLVFVGSYESHDVHCFRYCYGENWSYPLGYADDLTAVLPPRHYINPWKISSFNEWPDLFDFPNKAQRYPEVKKRLNQPLLGLSCISESRKTSVLVLQLSNTGDLFYEKLAARESSVQANVHKDFDLNVKGSSVTVPDNKKLNLGENDQEFITKWVELLMDHVHRESKEMLDELIENCTSIDAGIIQEELFSYLEEFEVQCCLCNGQSSREADDTMNSSCSSDPLENTDCSYCKMPRKLSDQINRFSKGDDQRKILTKKSLDLKYKADALKLFDEGIQCSEPLGNVLLRNWYSDKQLPVDFTGRNRNEIENDKQDSVTTWLEKDLESSAHTVHTQRNIRSPVRKRSKDTRRDEEDISPLRKYLETPLNRNTASHETKTLYMQSPKSTEKTHSNVVFQNSPNDFGSPHRVEQACQGVSVKILRTPDNSTSQISQTSRDKTPNFVISKSTPGKRLNSPSTTPGRRTRTPTKKKISRIPGF